MKQGDLVKCTWQPAMSFDAHLGHIEPMEYIIKGKFGFLVSKRNQGTWFVFFPEYGYIHPLTCASFEVVSETR